MFVASFCFWSSVWPRSYDVAYNPRTGDLTRSTGVPPLLLFLHHTPWWCFVCFFAFFCPCCALFFSTNCKIRTIHYLGFLTLFWRGPTWLESRNWSTWRMGTPGWASLNVNMPRSFFIDSVIYSPSVYLLLLVIPHGDSRGVILNARKPRNGYEKFAYVKWRKKDLNHWSSSSSPLSCYVLRRRQQQWGWKNPSTIVVTFLFYYRSPC